MGPVACQNTAMHTCATHRAVPRLDRISKGLLRRERESVSELVYVCMRVCDRKGELWALKSGGHSALCCTEGESKAHGAQESAGSTLSNFSFPHSLWMNHERDNAVLIRGERRDGLEAFAQTAVLKVVSFVGMYVQKRVCNGAKLRVPNLPPTYV